MQKSLRKLRGLHSQFRSRVNELRNAERDELAQIRVNHGFGPAGSPTWDTPHRTSERFYSQFNAKFEEFKKRIKRAEKQESALGWAIQRHESKVLQKYAKLLLVSGKPAEKALLLRIFARYVPLYKASGSPVRQQLVKNIETIRGAYKKGVLSKNAATTKIYGFLNQAEIQEGNLAHAIAMRTLLEGK